MTEQNRVKNLLINISDQIHELEIEGEELTKKEDKLWMELTNVIENLGLLNKPLLPIGQPETNRVLDKLEKALTYLEHLQSQGTEFTANENIFWSKTVELVQRYRQR